MTSNPDDEASTILIAAREALARGYQPVPIRKGSKAPAGAGWTHRRLTVEELDDEFIGVESLGLITGEASNGLVDVDLDHPIAWRMATIFLPPTPMRTGRAGNPSSHYWYRVDDVLPGYRKYTLPEGETAVELRSGNGHQTLIPPSIWYPKKGEKRPTEPYRWEAEPWGGEEGPAPVSGKVLAVRVASLALATVLVENWPEEGSRHDAYLALAGGMLRLGDQGVHPYWSQALPQLIEALAEATHDGDGASTRVDEVVPTTEAKLKVGGKAQGWTTLAAILGDKSVAKARMIVREIEDIVDWQRHLPLASTNQPLIKDFPDDRGGEEKPYDDSEDGPAEEKPINPLDARAESWEPVNLEPYLAGEIVVPEPSVLRRSDGKGIFYPGRVNSLYGRSESAKSWVMMYGCLQEISDGDRVVYIDLEDDPAMAIKRLRLMGAGDDDVRYQFTYLRPEGPHAQMQRDTWGNERPSELGFKNKALMDATLEQVNPGLIVVDGMSVLYGLHGLNTNDVASTDVITNWLKSLCRNGRSTVVVIDHTHKGAEKGASPIGSQHKISMVQGAAIQVVPVIQPKPGALGHVELVIGKDRPGAVREIANDDKHQIVADVFLDSREPGITKVTIVPPKKGDVTIAPSDESDRKLGEQAKLADAALQVFRNHVGEHLTISNVDAAIVYDGYSRSTLKRAIDGLAADGEIDMHSAKGRGGSEYWMPLPDDA